MEKEALEKLINALKEEGEVIAPKSNGTDLIYAPIECASEIDFTRIPLDNPKKLYFSYYRKDSRNRRQLP